MKTLDLLIGKGGVGKSSCSALLSLYFASRGQKTLIVSMDPAHNLGDIFERRFDERPRTIPNGPDVIEIDVEARIKRSLRESESQVKDSYSYLSSLNLESHFKVLRYAPGMEEAAMLGAFADILHRYREKYDRFVIDMPPTALSLRFLSLPSLSLVWLEELLKLRRKILKKQEIVEKIKVGKNIIHEDKVLKRLEKMLAEHRKYQSFFQSETCRIHIVANPEKLSLKEAGRLQQKLNSLGFAAYGLFLNKDKGEEISDIGSAFLQIRRIPLSERPLVSAEALSAFLGFLGWADEALSALL